MKKLNKKRADVKKVTLYDEGSSGGLHRCGGYPGGGSGH